MQINKKYNKWTIIKKEVSINKQSRYLCQCDCGTKKIVRSCHLKSGASKSCGCYAIEERIKNATKHGGCKNYPKELMIFYSAKARCQNPNNRGYKNYGGRGINFLYKNFQEFIDDIGKKPSDDFSLDRIDNDKNYEKGNCRWATRTEQNRNRRFCQKYKSETAKEASVRLGGSKDLVSARIRNGWSYQKAFTKPVN